MAIIADVPSTMIVGVHGLADETPRLHEYSPAFAPERFAAHARFSGHWPARNPGDPGKGARDRPGVRVRPVVEDAATVAVS